MTAPSRLKGRSGKIKFALLLWLLVLVALGYYGKCASGTCPLTSNYYISTIIGAAIGLLIATARR